MINSYLKTSLSAMTLVLAGSLGSTHSETTGSMAKVNTSISALELAQHIAESSIFGKIDPALPDNYQYPVVDYDCGSSHTHLFAETKADASAPCKFNV